MEGVSEEIQGDNVKAVVYTQYGPPDVLELKTIKKPTIKDNEVLVKIVATTVSSIDRHFRSADIFLIRFMNGLTKPKINVLGSEFAGVIEEVGKNVKNYKPKDPVYGTPRSFGCYGEYNAVVANERLAKKPANMTYERAAAIPFGGVTALRYLRDLGNIKRGHKVLINGASGSVGTNAVQIAKSYGARVTGVCSGGNIEMVRSLGADRVIDYTKLDFTKEGKKYDIIFDAVAKRSYSKCKGSLKKNGVYLSTVLTLPLLFAMLGTKLSKKKARFTIPDPKPGDLDFLRELVEAEKLEAVIDRTYPLSHIVRAHEYADKGHVKGKVVINVAKPRGSNLDS